jgi:DNA-binding NarL/FixJ family response regulator
MKEFVTWMSIGRSRIQVANAAVERLAERTQTAGTELALGIEARVRAFVSDGSPAKGLYREAIERLGRSRLALDRARAQRLYGEWLRRGRREADAREHDRIASGARGKRGRAARRHRGDGVRAATQADEELPRPFTRSRTRPRTSDAEALGAASSPIRVVVGDAEPIYQAGIAQLLGQAGVEVAATASNADDLARKIRAYHPDVVVLDRDLPPSLREEQSIETARRIRSIDPRMAILVLSTRPAERYALEVLGDQPEGFGYLMKARIRDAEDLAASVRRVARGDTAMDPDVVSQVVGARRSADPLEELTNREREVLALMAAGRSNGHIAAELVVTIAAVERHITSIFAKLGLQANADDHRRVLAVLTYLQR